MTTPGGQPGFAAEGRPVGPWLTTGWPVVPPAPKPGTVPLRPLDLGDVVTGVFATVRRYPAALYYPVLSAALGSAALFGGSLALGYATLFPLPDDGRSTGRQLLRLTPALAALLVLLLLLAFLVNAVATTVSTVVLRHAVLGQQLTVRQAWERARGRLRPVIVVQALESGIMLAILVGSALPSLLLFLLAARTAAAYALLLLVPGLAGALYVGVRLVLTVPVLVLEDQRPVAALRRAWRLNDGAWWRSLGIPYLVGMIGNTAARGCMLVLTVLVSRFLPDGTFDTGPAGSSGPLSVPAFTLLAVAVCAVVALMMTIRAPLAPLTSGLLYLDRRLRLENLGPTLAAAARTPWAPERR